MLLGAGTGGLALADVPSNWAFTFYSPGKNMLYMVNVEHGAAGEPREFGEAAKGTKITKSIDPATIEVGAAQAVAKAREFGSQSGTLPKNVMVGGSFARDAPVRGRRHGHRRLGGDVRQRHGPRRRAGVHRGHDVGRGRRRQGVGRRRCVRGAAGGICSRRPHATSPEATGLIRMSSTRSTLNYGWYVLGGVVRSSCSSTPARGS